MSRFEAAGHCLATGNVLKAGEEESSEDSA